MIIKIFDKGYSPITSLSTGDFSALEYRSVLSEIGDASFTLNLSHSKVNVTNLKPYNRIEIWDTAVRWTGYIVQNQIGLNTVTVKCLSMIGLLKKRIIGSAVTYNGQAGTLALGLITTMNGVDDTKITAGTANVTTAINLTMNRQSVLEVVKKMAEITGSQYEVDKNNAFNFKSVLGTDLSASVIFRFNVLQASQANILHLIVDEDADDVVTRAYGKSGAYTKTQDDATLQTAYGILEEYTDFRIANSQTDLDNLTASKLRSRRYSPTIDLSPDVDDAFEAGDTVRVQISNKMVSIDDTYQLLEKSVKILNGEKQISVKIDSLPLRIANNIRDLDSRLALIETKL